MKTNRFPPFPKEVTIGELYHPAMKIKTQEEADEYFERLVELEMRGGTSRKEAERIEKANLGYFAGYYDVETSRRVQRLFRCVHPVFGSERPDAKQAYETGRAMGKEE